MSQIQMRKCIVAHQNVHITPLKGYVVNIAHTHFMHVCVYTYIHTTLKAKSLIV